VGAGGDAGAAGRAAGCGLLEANFGDGSGFIIQISGVGYCEKPFPYTILAIVPCPHGESSKNCDNPERLRSNSGAAAIQD
jgi:hypothetical protein